MKRSILRLDPANAVDLEVQGRKGRAGILQVRWVPDGRHLLTRNADGTVYVVRIQGP